MQLRQMVMNDNNAFKEIATLLMSRYNFIVFNKKKTAKLNEA